MHKCLYKKRYIFMNVIVSSFSIKRFHTVAFYVQTRKLSEIMRFCSIAIYNTSIHAATPVYRAMTVVLLLCRLIHILYHPK